VTSLGSCRCEDLLSSKDIDVDVLEILLSHVCDDFPPKSRSKNPGVFTFSLFIDLQDISLFQCVCCVHKTTCANRMLQQSLSKRCFYYHGLQTGVAQPKHYHTCSKVDVSSLLPVCLAILFARSSGHCRESVQASILHMHFNVSPSQPIT